MTTPNHPHQAYNYNPRDGSNGPPPTGKWKCQYCGEFREGDEEIKCRPISGWDGNGVNQVWYCEWPPPQTQGHGTAFDPLAARGVAHNTQTTAGSNTQTTGNVSYYQSGGHTQVYGAQGGAGSGSYAPPPLIGQDAGVQQSIDQPAQGGPAGGGHGGYRAIAPAPQTSRALRWTEPIVAPNVPPGFSPAAAPGSMGPPPVPRPKQQQQQQAQQPPQQQPPQQQQVEQPREKRPEVKRQSGQRTFKKDERCNNCQAVNFKECYGDGKSDCEYCWKNRKPGMRHPCSHQTPSTSSFWVKHT